MTVRLNVNISEELNSRLDELAAQSGNTKSGLLRKAIAPLATSKSPTIGHPKSPRQDEQIMSLLRCFEQIELRPL